MLKNVSSTTPPPEKDDHFQQFDWIFPVSMSIFLMILTTWILISLIHYAVKTRKWRFNGHGSRTELLSSGLVYISVIACAVLCLFRFSSSIAFMSIGYGKNDKLICNQLADLAYSAYASIVLSRAIFLWLRQRTFYANKMLNVVYSKTVKFFSFTSIFIIVVYGISVVAYSMVPQNYQASTEGCVYQPDHELQPGYWIPAIVGIAFMNILLLGLLLYAILHVRVVEQKRKEMRANEDLNNYGSRRRSSIFETILAVSGSSRFKNTSYVYKKRTLSFINTQRKIKRILQHTFLFAILSFGSDIFSQVFSNVLISAKDHRRFSHLLFDMNAIIYLLFIIFSFDNFKKMLFSPFLLRSRKSSPAPDTS